MTVIWGGGEYGGIGEGDFVWEGSWFLIKLGMLLGEKSLVIGETTYEGGLHMGKFDDLAEAEIYILSGLGCLIEEGKGTY